MTTRRLTLVTAALLVIALGGFLLYSRQTSTASDDGTLDLSAQPAFGSADAPVSLVLFEDFRCPHCATFTEQVLPQIERAFVDSGQVRIHFVNFPVLGPASQRVAVAAECVSRQSESAFWDLEDALFRSQAELDDAGRLRDLVATYAPGIDQDAFRRCLADEETADAVAADVAAARSFGLTGTPSVVVDGRVVEATQAALDRAIRAALGSAP